MADLGLELDLAISAVKEEDGKLKDGKSAKDGKSSKDGKSRRKKKAGTGKGKRDAAARRRDMDGVASLSSEDDDDAEDDAPPSPDASRRHSHQRAPAQQQQHAQQQHANGQQAAVPSQPASALEYYFRKPAEALLRIAKPAPEAPEQWSDKDGFLMAEEYDSEDDSDTSMGNAGSDDPDADSGPSRGGDASGPGASARRRFARDGSRKRADLLYVSITGNVPAAQLSIAAVVDPEELELLASGQNYGVVIASDATAGRGKARGRGFGRKAGNKLRRRKGAFDVAIVRHAFKGMSAEGREEEDDDDGDTAGDMTPSASFLLRAGDSAAVGAMARPADGKHPWPPAPVMDAPEPPTEKPPRPGSRAAGSARTVGSGDAAGGSRPPSVAAPAPPRRSGRRSALLRAAGALGAGSDGSLPSGGSGSGKTGGAGSGGFFATSSDSLPVSGDALFELPDPLTERRASMLALASSQGASAGAGAGAVARQSKQLRKAPLQKQISMARAGISKGMNALSLGLFRPGTAPPRGGTTVAAKPGEERFLMAANVPYVIPAPPAPAAPPQDGSDEQQQQQDFELLRMFVEDLRATALKLDERKAIKQDKITRLQEEIERIDDEIADVLHPNAPKPASAEDAVVSQVESVTSGKIFGVEKYRR